MEPVGVARDVHDIRQRPAELKFQGLGSLDPHLPGEGIALWHGANAVGFQHHAHTLVAAGGHAQGAFRLIHENGEGVTLQLQATDVPAQEAHLAQRHGLRPERQPQLTFGALELLLGGEVIQLAVEEQALGHGQRFLAAAGHEETPLTVRRRPQQEMTLVTGKRFDDADLPIATCQGDLPLVKAAHGDVADQLLEGVQADLDQAFVSRSSASQRQANAFKARVVPARLLGREHAVGVVG